MYVSARELMGKWLAINITLDIANAGTEKTYYNIASTAKIIPYNPRVKRIDNELGLLFCAWAVIISIEILGSVHAPNIEVSNS
jgi:hypothetical protein